MAGLTWRSGANVTIRNRLTRPVLNVGACELLREALVDFQEATYLTGMNTGVGGWMRRLMVGAALVSATAAAPAVARADAHITIVTRPRQPPPPPPPEPVQRRDGWVWVGGHYEWRQGEYVWVGGHMVRERRGHVWHEGRWRRHGHVYRWHDGRWYPHR
jgi:hypothetical protein